MLHNEIQSPCRPCGHGISPHRLPARFAQELTIEDYVRGLITDNAAPDETLIGGVQIRELEEGDDAEISYRLDPEKMYVVYGACDDDCTDFDLLAEDGDGEEVDSDEEDDDAPLLMILPGEAGDQLTIRAHMSTCDADVCVLGVGLYESDL